MNKEIALKKVEIAIDKMIDLGAYKNLEKIDEPRRRALEILRELSNRLL